MDKNPFPEDFLELLIEWRKEEDNDAETEFLSISDDYNNSDSDHNSDCKIDGNLFI